MCTEHHCRSLEEMGLIAAPWMWPSMQTFTMNRECNEHHVMEKIKKMYNEPYLPNLIPRSAITNVSLSREAPEIFGVSFTIHENVLISPLTSASMIAC